MSGDEALRRWTSFAVHDESSAARWLREQRHGGEQGRRCGFAVEEADPSRAGGPPVGHAVLKEVVAGGPSAEVGYWPVARARGRGVAPRTLRALSDRAVATFARDGLTRLLLRRQAADTASCRVAEKSRHDLAAVLPAKPPACP
ncbi:GNAT family N-acetyltransferase [Streptomyces sp. NPDC092370]|uniref:GNAT family N-acetyltransferase n=1 Tax=Streptomyces sp. NPDC092370 TaxID=3366016 RepID=UPI003801E655